MKIFVGQIYAKAGVNFPFTIRFQQWLGAALSERTAATEEFSNMFGAGFGLGLRISAKEEIDQTEIKGPTVFKRDKDVEFSIFLPHRPKVYHDPAVAVLLVDQVLQSVTVILQQIGLDPTNVARDVPLLLSEFLRTPEFLKERVQKGPCSN
jgi:hypothetical protein